VSFWNLDADRITTSVYARPNGSTTPSSATSTLPLIAEDLAVPTTLRPALYLLTTSPVISAQSIVVNPAYPTPIAPSDLVPRCGNSFDNPNGGVSALSINVCPVAVLVTDDETFVTKKPSCPALDILASDVKAKKAYYDQAQWLAGGAMGAVVYGVALPITEFVLVPAAMAAAFNVDGRGADLNTAILKYKNCKLGLPY
jgi:hypothetical protein